MIKIHPQIWYILEVRKSERTLLAYMTHFEENVAFTNRCSTGCVWAGGYAAKLTVDDGVRLENEPVIGFRVVESVSRWSTSNKLFRIQDPRGFIAEIPSNNLAQLLLHTTVKNGRIQEECVWGKDGQNHILLPINSEPYKIAIAKINQFENELIKPSELKAGDWVETFKGQKLYFAGRARITWKNERTGETVTDKWTWLFLKTYEHDKERTIYFESPTQRIVRVINTEKIDWIPRLSEYHYPPVRVKNRFVQGISSPGLRQRWNGRYDDVSDKIKVEGVEYK